MVLIFVYTCYIYVLIIKLRDRIRLWYRIRLWNCLCCYSTTNNTMNLELKSQMMFIADDDRTYNFITNISWIRTRSKIPEFCKTTHKTADLLLSKSLSLLLTSYSSKFRIIYTNCSIKDLSLHIIITQNIHLYFIWIN